MVTGTVFPVEVADVVHQALPILIFGILCDYVEWQTERNIELSVFQNKVRNDKSQKLPF